MHPAFSVVFLTTLIGVGQGLFLALYAAELGALLGWLPAQPPGFFVLGSVIALAFLVAGLGASFLHLGRPERAWRAAVMWRTSWLSREVIVLPAFMGLVFAYGGLHYLGSPGTAIMGAVGVAICLALFVCTGMIYACIAFLQEWATPLTIVNFLLLGCASGFMFATGYAFVVAPDLAPILGVGAVILTISGFVTRVAALMRNARLRPKSTLQTAIGVKHPRIAQKSQGFMGGSFNTREFFHGRTARLVRVVRWSFLSGTFALPLLILIVALFAHQPALAIAAFILQYGGLIAERWYFFAEARHPQNLYYQAMS